MAMPTPENPHQRRAERIPFLEPVQIRKPAALRAQGVDLGQGGIGLRTTEPLPVGAAVELELFGGRAIFLGSVRWCQPLGSGFRIGVEFSAGDTSLIARVQALRAADKGKTGA